MIGVDEERRLKIHLRKKMKRSETPPSSEKPGLIFFIQFNITILFFTLYQAGKPFTRAPKRSASASTCSPELSTKCEWLARRPAASRTTLTFATSAPSQCARDSARPRDRTESQKPLLFI